MGPSIKFPKPWPEHHLKTGQAKKSTQPLPCCVSCLNRRGIFAFGSGYFYKPKETNCQFSYAKRKISRLLIPFFLCNVFYGIVVLMLRPLGVEIGESLSFYTLFIAPLQHCHQFMYNLGTWFVIPLFIILIINNLLHKLLSFTKKRTIILFLFTCCSGLSVLNLLRLGLIPKLSSAKVSGRA